MTSPLFTSSHIGPLRLRNRFIRSAAFEGMCPDGLPSPSLVEHHRSMAAGGVGLTTVAYASVSEGGRSFAHQLWMREHALPGLRQLTDAVHQHGAAASIQLGHCGNMADQNVTGQRPLAPSAVFNLFGLARPKAMSEEDIELLLQDFERSAALALKAGFDAVEIHAGHGYLISQFLSPHTNRRTDRWGGPLEGRARLIKQLIPRVKEATAGRLAVIVKMNLCDGFAGGMELDEAVALAPMLEQQGADALVLSGGFVSKCPMYIMRGEVPLKEMVASQELMTHKIGLALFGRFVVKAYPFEEAYFLQDALQIRQAVDLPLVLVGGMISLERMEQVLEQGFEFVALARALIREPDFVARLQRGEIRESLCKPCNKCMATMYYGEALCPEREDNGAGHVPE